MPRGWLARTPVRPRRTRRRAASLMLGFVVLAILAMQSGLGRQSCVLAASGVHSKSVRTDELLVVGAGHLGRLVARQWLQEHPQARVIGVTSTDSSHEEHRQMGIEPFTPGVDLRARVPPGSIPNVFCAPPRGGAHTPEAYGGAVSDALSFWSRHPDGGFVFTSSGGVFDQDGGVVDEELPVSALPRSSALLEAERQVGKHSGTVLRLAGL